MTQYDLLGLLIRPRALWDLSLETQVKCTCSLSAGIICLRDPYPKDTLKEIAHSTKQVKFKEGVPILDPERLIRTPEMTSTQQLIEIAGAEATKDASDLVLKRIVASLAALAPPWQADLTRPIGSISCSCVVLVVTYQYAGNLGGTELNVPVSSSEIGTVDEVVNDLDDMRNNTDHSF